MGPQRQNKQWICCFGVHVHTGAIIIGIWHLFFNILALSLLSQFWRNPTYESYDHDVQSSFAPERGEYSYTFTRRHKTFDFGGLMCMCIIIVTLMMIYGTVKGKPSHILPFFCLQLFDFAITTLTVGGYLCYLKHTHRLVGESHIPWREKLLELSPDELVLVTVILCVCIVFLKGYAISIVWRCYKYQTLRQQHMRNLLPLSGRNFILEERPHSTLLPNYDEAIAQHMKQAPPPSYKVAMSHIQEIQGNIQNCDQNNDNNNDTPNNNNTVHVNANSMPDIHNISNSGANLLNNDLDKMSPPSYNVVIGINNPEEQNINENSAQNINTDENRT